MEKNQPTVDQQIQAEIDRIRSQFPRTQDLYREACTLLFFRFGVTPTANKLYQFVRKGSMSAPAEALSIFWADLREKSRVRIEHPDLPQELRAATGDLAATLWHQAQAMAQETFTEFRAEAQVGVAEASAARTKAEAERDGAVKELSTAKESILALNNRANTLEQQLAAEKATRIALETQLGQTAQDIATLQKMLEKARQDFAEEMDELHAAARLTEERYRAAEERALLEIDRERTTVSRLQKELDQNRAKLGQVVDRHKMDISALHAEVGQCRQQLGSLEGQSKAAIADRNRIAADLDDARIQLTAAVSQAAVVRVESGNWKQKYEEAAAMNIALQTQGKRRQRQPAAS